jgi:hypothetical protein
MQTEKDRQLRWGGRGWARSRIIRPQESLVLYKSFNTLCCRCIRWLFRGGRGRARSRIIRPQESLVLYKSFNTLCCRCIRWLLYSFPPDGKDTNPIISASHLFNYDIRGIVSIGSIHRPLYLTNVKAFYYYFVTTTSSNGNNIEAKRYLMMYWKLWTYFYKNTYIAEIQLPGNSFGCSPYQEVLHRVLIWLAIGDFHRIMFQLTKAWSWAFLLKPWVRQALLSCRHSAKHTSPSLSST